MKAQVKLEVKVKVKVVKVKVLKVKVKAVKVKVVKVKVVKVKAQVKVKGESGRESES